jgi:tRNA G18 (ribose-2'-O)-methylase SpoU
VTERGLAALATDLAGCPAPVYLAPQPVVEAVAGYKFHRGALAAADRAPLPELGQIAATATLLVLVEGVNDHENLGALFRNAAAFGAGGVLLDPTSADPLYRRSVRVSMGHVLKVPYTRVTDWPAGIAELRSLGFEVLALTPAPEAEDIGDVELGRRQALMVGAEGPGLTPGALEAADRRVRIALAPGVDSLNVATAAAIALHHLGRVD